MSKPQHPPSMFRSLEMALCQFFIPNEVAFACLDALGKIGKVQFRDMNPDLGLKDRTYNTEMNILLNIQAILRHIEAEIKKRDLKIPQEDDDIPTPSPGDILEVQQTIENYDQEIKDIQRHIDTLQDRYGEAIEMRSVQALGKKYLQPVELKKTQASQKADVEADVSEEEEETKRGHGEKTMKVNFEAGVILREKFAAFEKALWRSSRGKIIPKFEHIDHNFENKEGGNAELKTAFIIFFQGEKMREVVKQVMDGFRAKQYKIPDDPAQCAKAEKSSDQDSKDIKKIIDVTEQRLEDILDTCADNIENWFCQVVQMKSIYNTLNNFTPKPHIGEGWVAFENIPEVRETLEKAAKDAGGLTSPVVSPIDYEEEPPTSFWTDKFTYGFQSLIDAYGIATYKEVNPMPYTVVTFPFLFAVMFGDLGHGAILFVFGVLMIAYEKQMMAKKSKNEIRNIFFGGRYIILLMGIHSMYSGFIYNDCFSLSFDIFGSSWTVSRDLDEIKDSKQVKLDPKDEYSGKPYPMGIDCAWDHTGNKIIFLNSFKMKISIIFGVLQMLLGLCLSIWNYCYFRNYSDIPCTFIPQMIWMLGLFGWMCVLMFIKWFKYGPKNPYPSGPTCAPSVLITFIDMILQNKAKMPPGCDEYMIPNQGLIQTILVLCSLCCIPWLLILKPIVVFSRKEPKEENEPTKGKKEDKQKKGVDEKGERPSESEIKEMEEGGVNEGGDMKGKGETEGKKKPPQEKEKKSEFMIHQAILTIEYILGTISHTASYLRLWALSLAHSQLSQVLWDMVLSKIMLLTVGLPPYIGFILVFFVWSAWAALTLAILVLMEGLSAFLHTLRLHWVEFNSKFYSGIGYEFVPFSYVKILKIERA